MIFAPELAEKVRRGEKTVTRRVAVLPTCRYKPGRSYSVQTGRGKRGIARIRILSVELRRLHDISDADARAEGFADVPAFGAYWKRLYGSVDWGCPVWRIVFVLDTERRPTGRSESESSSTDSSGVVGAGGGG